MEEKLARYGRYAADGAAATDDRAERSTRSTDAGQDQAFVVLDACHALIEQYQSLLGQVGRRNELTVNEMLVLVQLALMPDACTQKDLMGTHMGLSVSSVCRMVESLRQKECLTTEVDVHDRRSWLIHLTDRGHEMAEEFRDRLHVRLDEILGAVPGLDPEAFVTIMDYAGDAARQRKDSPGKSSSL